MPEEISSIGVKLTLDAGGYMAGMTKATERTDAFVASVEKASTVAGAVGSSGGAAKSLPAQKVPLDLSVSTSQLTALRKQIIAGIGVIPIQVTAQMTKTAQAEAKAVMAAVSTPAVGTRSGAATAVQSTVRRNLPTRASGGPVQAGQEYIVGEHRPEVFRPRQSGTILPDAARYMRQMHGGGYAHRAAGGDVFAKYAAELTEWKRNLLQHASGISPELAKSARHWYEIARAQALGDLADFGRPGSNTNIGAFAAASPGQAWPSNRAILREILAKGMHGSKTINRDVPGFGMTQATAPYGYTNWTKAAQILKTGDISGLKGPKVTPFFANLSGQDPELWTLDARQMRIASANKLTSAPAGGSWQRKILERAHEDVYPELQRMWGVKARSQAQAVLWAGYGRGEDLGTDFTRTKSGIVIPRHPGILVPTRQGGGFVEKFFHATSGILDPVKNAFATAAGWAKDPFMAWQAWQGAQGQRASRGAMHMAAGGPAFEGIASEWWEKAKPWRSLSSTERYTGRGKEIPGVPPPNEALKAAWMSEYAAGSRPEYVLSRNMSGETLGGLRKVLQWNDDGTVKVRSWSPDLFRPQTLQAEEVWPATKSVIDFVEADQKAYAEHGWHSRDRRRIIAEARFAIGEGPKPTPVRKNKIGQDEKGRPIVVGPKGQELTVSGMEPLKASELRGWRNQDEDSIREFIEAHGDVDILQAVHDRAEARAGYEPGVGRMNAKKLSPEEIQQYLDETASQLVGVAPPPKAMPKTKAARTPKAQTEAMVEEDYDDYDEEGAGAEPATQARSEKPAKRVKGMLSGERARMSPEEMAAYRASLSPEEQIRLLRSDLSISRGHLQTLQGYGPGNAARDAKIVEFQADIAEWEAQLAGLGVAAKAAVEATPPPTVPHVKSPEQLEHERIAEVGIARREEREAALKAQKSPFFDVVPRKDQGVEEAPFERTARLKKVQVAEEQALLERAKKAGLYLRRQKGGPAGEGLYIVNEAGPEAFLTAHDAGRLGQRRPDILAGIPGGDGARTGMINKPPWSMFAPQQDGMIVPAHLAKAALGALHAQGGGWVGGSGGPVVTPGGFTPTGPIATGGFTPTGPIIQTAETAFNVAARALAAFTASVTAATAATKLQVAAGEKATTLLEAGPGWSPEMVGQIRMGPGTTPPVNVLPPGGTELTPEGPVPAPLIYQGGVGEPAVPGRYYARAARATVAAGLTPSKESGMAAAPTAAPTAASIAPVVEAVVNAREGQWGRFSALAEALQEQEPGISNLEISKAIGIPFEMAPKLSKEGAATARVREYEAKHIISREREFGPDPVLSAARQRTAGSSAFMTERTSRGVAAVLGALGLGGGLEFKRRQRTFQEEEQAYKRVTAEVTTWKNELTENQHKLADLTFSEEDRNILLAEQTQIQDSLADAQGKQAVQAKKYADAEKAIQPTTAGVIRSFGSIILATSAYGVAFSAVNKVIGEALIPTVQKFVDEASGFAPTMTRVTNTLAEGTHAAFGNVQAVTAQAAATAGLSGPMMDFVGASLTASIEAKAAAKAQQETSELFRASMAAQTQTGRGRAPEGLYGGFGGLLGTALFGEQLGGGKGFTEIISQDLQKAGGVEGINQQSINQMVAFSTNKTFRDVFMREARGAGAAERPEFGGLETYASALDFLPKLAATFATPAPYAAVPGIGGMLGQLAPSLLGPLVPPDRAPVGIVDRGAEARGPLAPVMVGKTAVEQRGIEEYLKDLGASADRGAEANDRQTVATYGLTASTSEMDDAMMTAFKAGDAAGMEMAALGIVLRDTAGNVVTDLDAYQTAVEDMARGKGIVPPEVWAQQNVRQLTAQRQGLAMQAERQINVEIPIDAMKQLLAAPIIRPGLGFFPGAGRGAPSPGAAGLTGRAAGMAGGALRETAEANTALQAMATEGLAQARADLAQFTPEALPDFNAAYKDAQSASSSIATLTSRMASLNRQASQASWANQIRLANRALGDALGLLREGGTRFGQLSRQQYDVGRQSQQLQLQLQQRQITTQIALAGFQAPGETGEERYMRQKEKLAEADIAQQQLGFSFREFTISGTLWKMNAERAATDASMAIGVMQKARNAEGYAIAAQEAIAKRSQQLAQAVGKMDALLGASRGAWSGAVNAAVSGIGQFSGALKVGVRDIFAALGYTKNPRTGRYQRPQASSRNLDQVSGGFEAAGHMGNYASGYLGAFAKGATFTVGEAGPETVAILRNPRTHMLGGGGEGGGTNNVHVNINGPVVRNDDDIAELARCVAEEVERALSRKGQILGLRSPAY